MLQQQLYLPKPGAFGDSLMATTRHGRSLCPYVDESTWEQVLVRDIEESISARPGREDFEP